MSEWSVWDEDEDVEGESEEEDEEGIGKGNLTDVDSADLDREEIMLGKEESMMQSAHASNMFFNQRTRAGRMGTMAGDGNGVNGGMNSNIDVGFGDGFGDLNSDFDNPMMLGNRSNFVGDDFQIG